MEKIYATITLVKLIFTDHLKTRLRQRKIPLKIVRQIFSQTQEFFYDTLRKHHIVVSTVIYNRKPRKVLAAYDKIDQTAEIITIHPITDKEIEGRLESGRWIYEKIKS